MPARHLFSDAGRCLLKLRNKDCCLWDSTVPQALSTILTLSFVFCCDHVSGFHSVNGSERAATGRVFTAGPLIGGAFQVCDKLAEHTCMRFT